MTFSQYLETWTSETDKLRNLRQRQQRLTVLFPIERLEGRGWIGTIDRAVTHGLGRVCRHRDPLNSMNSSHEQMWYQPHKCYLHLWTASAQLQSVSTVEWLSANPIHQSHLKVSIPPWEPQRQEKGKDWWGSWCLRNIAILLLEAMELTCAIWKQWDIQLERKLFSKTLERQSMFSLD